jgi:hypothetical protein
VRRAQLPTQITEDRKRESAEIRSNSRKSAIHNAALLAARDCTVEPPKVRRRFVHGFPRIEADLADQGSLFNNKKFGREYRELKLIGGSRMLFQTSPYFLANFRYVVPPSIVSGSRA